MTALPLCLANLEHARGNDMKWFKHDADANQDAKLQNVLLDYGLEGYGLYWYCIELIAGNVDQDTITFHLEHDARIIARNTGSTPQKVEEMMRYFVEVGLFENCDGVITCLKLAKRLDKSMTSNPQMRKLIEQLKNHDSVMTESENVMQDKIRLDQNRLDKKNNNSAQASCANDAFERVWQQWPAKKAKKKAGDAFKNYVKRHRLDPDKFADQLIHDVCKRCELQQFGFDKMHFTTYINGERWNDEYSKPQGANTSHDLIDGMDFSDLDTATNYNKQLTTDQLELFKSMAKQVGFSTFHKAMMAHMQDPEAGMYFPNMAHISAKINGTKKELEASNHSDAELQWNEVMSKIAKCGTYNAPNFDDDITAAAVDAVGGWYHLCMSTTDQLHWIGKEFVKCYKEYKQRPIERLPKRVAGIVGHSEQRQGGGIMSHLLENFEQQFGGAKND